MKTVRAPLVLNHPVFLLFADRDSLVFRLAIPDGSTFQIPAKGALQYLTRSLERAQVPKAREVASSALDTATNFGAALCWPQECRAEVYEPKTVVNEATLFAQQFQLMNQPFRQRDE